MNLLNLIFASCFKYLDYLKNHSVNEEKYSCTGAYQGVPAEWDHWSGDKNEIRREWL